MAEVLRGGSRKKNEIVAMGNFFASRGWVFVSIDYRTAKNLGTIHTGIAPQKWIDASNNSPQMIAGYTAQRDAKAALRWIVANADTYNINTDFITVGGGSAGAITAIGLGISEQEDFRDEISTTVDPTLLTTNLNETFNIRSIIDFWGNDLVLRILKMVYGHDRFDSNDPELFIAHGTEDKRAVPFSGANDLVAIYKSIGVYAKLVPLEGAGHGAWDATVNGKSLSDLSFEFLVERQNLNVENSDSPNSINKVDEEKNVMSYNQTLKMIYLPQHNIKSLQIINFNGQKIREYKFPKQSISISNLPSGTYIVKGLLENNHLSIMKIIN